jgi:hypothetical protein
MSQELWIGVVLLAVAASLFFIALPDKDGVSPRFLRFDAALGLYPPAIMIFLVGGAAELLTALLRVSH